MCQWHNIDNGTVSILAMIHTYWLCYSDLSRMHTHTHTHTVRKAQHYIAEWKYMSNAELGQNN